MSTTIDSDLALLVHDDSKLVALLASALVFLVLLAAVVIVYIAVVARRIGSSKPDMLKWKRPGHRENVDAAKCWGEHSKFFQENQTKAYGHKLHFLTKNTLQPNPRQSIPV